MRPGVRRFGRNYSGQAPHTPGRARSLPPGFPSMRSSKFRPAYATRTASRQTSSTCAGSCSARTDRGDERRRGLLAVERDRAEQPLHARPSATPSAAPRDRPCRAAPCCRAASVSAASRRGPSEAIVTSSGVERPSQAKDGSSPGLRITGGGCPAQRVTELARLQVEPGADQRGHLADRVAPRVGVERVEHPSRAEPGRGERARRVAQLAHRRGGPEAPADDVPTPA